MKTFIAVTTILTAGVLCAQTTHADEAFLKDAAQGGMAEVKFGELAQNDGTSSTVKQFGQRMVLDHTKMNGQVKDLAATKNISLPGSVGIKEEASYKLLQAKSGDSFDKSYIEDMLKDHRADIAAFQKEVDSGSDPDIKAFAAQALPTLRQHLRLAEKAAKELGITSTSGGMR
jgi:putative membrane protein